MPNVVVLDYGSGNLRSAQRALARVGAQVEVTADADAVLECDGLAAPIYRTPLVDGTPGDRGSNAAAARSARATALNWASTMWCGLRP